MTREEAISIITKERDEDIFGGWTPYRKRIHEAFTLAIEALKGEQLDEWCTDCKEYDTEKKCCPRFNRVIREAMKRIPHEDGTLEVKVEDATKVGRVLISDDKHRGGLYYPDEDEPQSVSFENDTEIKSCSKDSDLISRAEAIEALGEEPPVWCDEEYEIAERNQWRADIEAIESVPSADRPRGGWIEETSWKYKKGGRNSDMKEILGTEWMTMMRQRCSECNKVTMVDGSILYKYCPHCGSEMRSE